jgi:hypothetical protein
MMGERVLWFGLGLSRAGRNPFTILASKQPALSSEREAAKAWAATYSCPATAAARLNRVAESAESTAQG